MMRAAAPLTGIGGTLKPATYTDSSGTPGNVTNNSARGKAAFAAAASAVVVTSSVCSATSSILTQLETNDTTLTSVKSAVPGAGSFTVTGLAAATATTVFSFVVVN
jgi:predicted nucleotide-binding protein